MTNKERIINCAVGESIDRSPFFFYFGPWGETVAAWAKQGVTNPDAWHAGFGFDPGVCMLSGFVNHLFLPGFTPRVISQSGDRVVSLNYQGEIVESIAGREGIPKILKSPVESREDWERLKAERLNPADPERFCPGFADITEGLKKAEFAIQVGTYPCGLFGTLRDLMGVEGALLGFYDEPELVRDIMNQLTDLWLYIYEKISHYIQIDIIHIWEDMSGKQGSLISPDMVLEFMLPNYKRIHAFAENHGIKVMQVDTDGECEGLIPLFAEAGVNMMLPFEVSAGSDIVKLREKYPYMSMLGGIDKLEIAKGREHIDAELERVAPLINKPGYFPALDHLIHPGISFEDYSYFVNRLKIMIFGE